MEQLEQALPGFEALSEDDLAKLSGGSWGRFIEIVGLSLINNWQDFREGLQDGLSGKEYRYN